MKMSVLSDYERGTAPQPGKSLALPLGAYSDSAIFDLEMERVFRRDWIGVCGADELPKAGADPVQQPDETEPL